MHFVQHGMRQMAGNSSKLFRLSMQSAIIMLRCTLGSNMKFTAKVSKEKLDKISFPRLKLEKFQHVSSYDLNPEFHPLPRFSSTKLHLILKASILRAFHNSIFFHLTAITAANKHAISRLFQKIFQQLS